MSKTSDTLKGAGTGAALGYYGGPWGALIGGGIGGLGGFMGLLPGTGEKNDAANNELQDIRKRYEAYRPAAMQAREESLSRALGMYAPMAQQLGNKWGQQINLPDPRGILTSPQLQGAGNSQAPGPAAPKSDDYSLWNDLKSVTAGDVGKAVFWDVPKGVHDNIAHYTPFKSVLAPTGSGLKDKAVGAVEKGMDWIF